MKYTKYVYKSCLIIEAKNLDTDLTKYIVFHSA